MKRILMLCLCLHSLFSFAQKPYLVIPSGQNSYVSAFDITPDGKFLLSASQDRSVKVYLLKEKREVFTFWGHSEWVTALQVNKDNRTVVSGDNSGLVIWWDLYTGKELSRKQLGSDQITVLQFSPDGRQLLSGSYAGDVALWNTAKRDTAYWFRYHDFPVRKLQFSQDHRYFVTGAPDSSKADSAANLRYINTLSSDSDTAEMFFSSALFESFALSPAGKELAVITNAPASLRFYPYLSLERSHLLELSDITLRDVFYLNKDTLVLAGTRGENLKLVLVNTATKQIIREMETTFSVYWPEVKPYPGRPDELVVLPADSFSMFSFSLSTGKTILLNPSHTNIINNVTAGNDVVYLPSQDKTLKRWDLKKNSITPILTDSVMQRYAVRQGERLLIQNLSSWKIWNEKTGLTEHEHGPVSDNTREIKSMHYSPDGQWLMEVTSGDTIRVYETGGYTLKKSVPTGYRQYIRFRGIGWLNNQVIHYTNSGKSSQTLYLYDIEQGRLVDSITMDYTINQAAGLPGGKIALGLLGGSMLIYDYQADRILSKARLKDTGRFLFMQFDARTNRIMTSLEDGEILFVDPNTMKVMERYTGHKAWVSFAPAFSDDRRLAYTASYDNTIRIWNPQTMETLATLSVLDGRDWVVANETGLFDASPGAMKLIYYVVNTPGDTDEPYKIIELDQLKHRYYQPDLLQIRLGYSSQKLREVPALQDIQLAPKTRTSLLAGNRLNISLENQGGGIGRVEVFLDDAELLKDARPGAAADKTKAGLGIDIDLNRYAARFYQGRPNRIKVVAWNGGEWLHSRADTLSFVPASAKGTTGRNTVASAPAEKPRLYALVMGTSDYAGTQIDLRFAAKDAEDFAAALKASAGRLFGADKVDVRLMTTGQGQAPTKANFTALLKEFQAKAKPWDILMVYLSGHGVNYGGAEGDFYYLTSQAAGADAAYLNDPAVRGSAAISSNEMTELLNGIAARKKILVLDACASGKAAEVMIASVRDVPASQVRALDRMTDRTGFYILSGSASDAVSYESSVYGQGLLTYSLLKAMKGAALRADGGEEYIDIQKLLQYAVDEVPRLAEGIGGIQKPLYRSPGDQQSFDVGKADAETKKSIIISEPKPVFVATGFQDMNLLFDELGLSEKMNAQLRENTAKGKEASLIFTEARDYPGAYRLSGTYQLSGKELSLRYVITKDRQLVREARVYTGDFSDPGMYIGNFMKHLLQQGL